MAIRCVNVRNAEDRSGQSHRTKLCSNAFMFPLHLLTVSLSQGRPSDNEVGLPEYCAQAF